MHTEANQANCMPFALKGNGPMFPIPLLYYLRYNYIVSMVLTSNLAYLSIVNNINILSMILPSCYLSLSILSMIIYRSCTVRATTAAKTIADDFPAV